MANSVTPEIATSALMDQVSQSIERLRQLSQLTVQSSWRYYDGDLPIAQIPQPEEWNRWAIADLNERGHVVWSAGRQVLWLCQKLVIPQDLQGYALQGLTWRLGLTWWADAAQIFVNSQLVQEGDLFDCSARILLSSGVIPGEEVTVALRLVSPGHDKGALVRSVCVYEALSPEDDCSEPGFVADELAVVQHYLSTFEPEKLPILAAAVCEIDWSTLGDREASPLESRQRFNQSLLTLRQQLQPLGDWLRQRQILMVGHAHLDLAWLWDVAETWNAAERTFNSVLNLQKTFPDLTFCHSTPALYDWIEQNRPNLFAAIQQQVAAGFWEIVAGLWVEPELNLINGESIIRQVLYGQRYVQEKFGKLSSIAWLPDSFGFCWQLPQILKQGGVDYFVTQKLRWNDSTKFPYDLFWWRSPDGSQILSYMSPLIGESTDPVKMATYACDWETKTGNQAALWLPGVGDHGGGPTRDMLETAQRWQNSSLFPRLKFTTVLEYLQQIEATTFPLPIWDDELYLEFHRGCYTTHADQKQWNRHCESLLYQAELFASLATLTAGRQYPKAELETAWKQVLFNQFHDILPGSSIPQVFVDANQGWIAAEQAGEQILAESLRAIAAQINFPPPPHPDAQPIVVFNSLNWARSQIVTVAIPEVDERVCLRWQIFDLERQEVQSQCRFAVFAEKPTCLLSFLAEDIPSIGFRVFWRCPCLSALPTPASVEDSVLEKKFVLENEFLRITVDPTTGDLSSVFDKAHQREVLSDAGNQLQAFQDSGQYWDAWNIDPAYAEHPLPPTILKTIQWVERGPLQDRLRVVRQLGQSEFKQDYLLEVRSPLLKIVTIVDWRERQVLVKAAFPLNIEADYATYEIPCGAIDRPTRPQEPQDKAKWEVPALRWADLSDETYGVSLLNDCKYGYDSQPDQLRLTLLRSPSWPNPNADQGHHEFTYALYPHHGTWQSAQTVRKGYELNQPLQEVLCTFERTSQTKPLQPVGQLLDLQADNLILSAFKQAEEDSQSWILRCYECHGEATQMTLQSNLNLQDIHPTDLLENPSELPELTSKTGCFEVNPWRITTFAMKISPA